jgi:mRNA interferase MazF
MERFAIGQVITTTFPFSDLKGAKVRPALILAKAEFGNFILCQITSKPYSSKIALKLEKADFAKGSLPSTSYVRPDKLFTADEAIFRKIWGQITVKKQKQISQLLQKMFAV